MRIAQKHTTAILVFANSSQEELKRKPIHQAGALFNALTEQTLATVKTCELPYFHFSEQEQSGNTFGERFVQAIQAVFDKGYDHIITIGNDTPQLMRSHILEAHEKLQAKKFVLGPSRDGGFYLMGLHKSQFDASQFQQFAWQTAHLIKEVSSFAQKQGADVIRLHVFYDLDSLMDIKKLLHYRRQFSITLLAIFQELLKEIQIISSFFCMLIDRIRSKDYFNKGSPSLLLTPVSIIP